MNPLIPSFLYSSSQSPRSAFLGQELNPNSNTSTAFPNLEESSSLTTVLSLKNFLIASPAEPGKGSATFYTVCIFGGVLSFGLTHTAVTPLDVVKYNMQPIHTQKIMASMNFGGVQCGFQCDQVVEASD